jgi:hypothetical protein
LGFLSKKLVLLIQCCCQMKYIPVNTTPVAAVMGKAQYTDHAVSMLL